MCLVCGDLSREHVSVDSITWADVERAARANNMSIDQTVRNLDASLRMISTTGGDVAGMLRGQAAARQKYGEPDTGGDELHPRELEQRDEMLQKQGGIKSGDKVIPAADILARDDVPAAREEYDNPAAEREWDRDRLHGRDVQLSGTGSSESIMEKLSENDTVDTDITGRQRGADRVERTTGHGGYVKGEFDPTLDTDRGNRNAAAQQRNQDWVDPVSGRGVQRDLERDDTLSEERLRNERLREQRELDRERQLNRQGMIDERMVDREGIVDREDELDEESVDSEGRIHDDRSLGEKISDALGMGDRPRDRRG